MAASALSGVPSVNVMPSRTLIVQTVKSSLGSMLSPRKRLDLEVVVGDEQRLEERPDAHLAVRVALHVGRRPRGADLGLAGDDEAAADDGVTLGRRERRDCTGIVVPSPPSAAVVGAVPSAVAWSRPPCPPARVVASVAGVVPLAGVVVLGPADGLLVLLVRAGCGDQPEADGRRRRPCPATPRRWLRAERTTVPLVVVFVDPVEPRTSTSSSAAVTPVTDRDGR